MMIWFVWSLFDNFVTLKKNSDELSGGTVHNSKVSE